MDDEYVEDGGDDWQVACTDHNTARETVTLLPNTSQNRSRNDGEEKTTEDDIRHGRQRISSHHGTSYGRKDNEDEEDDDDDDGIIIRRFRCCRLKPKIYVAMASAMAALGGVLFGYDTGIISGAILQLNDEFNLSCPLMEILISALMMGAVAASIIGGFLVDWFGRRLTIIANDVVFLVGTVIVTSAQSYITLVIGRFVIGFAVSLSATADCVYITEISPPSRRGLLVSLNELGITLGFLAAYLFNFLFIGVHGGWRYMFGAGAVLAIFQGVGMFFLPKSPRYLVIKGEEQKAKHVLRILLGNQEAEDEFERIRTSVTEEKNLKTSDFCCYGKNNIFPALLMSMTLIVLQQISGQPSVLLYAPIIFREVGLKTNAASVLATVGLGFVKFLVTIVYLVIIDKVGRRRLLMGGAAMMMVSVLVLGLLVGKLFPDSRIASECKGEVLHPQQYSSQGTVVTDDVIATNDVIATQGPDDLRGFGEGGIYAMNDTVEILQRPSDDLGSSAGTWLAMIAVFFYIAGYSIGFGPGTWLLMSEIFTSSVKGRAIAFATTINWALQMITSVTFLNVIVAIGIHWLFISYSVVCAFAVLFIYFVVPETKGKSLEVVTSQLKPFSKCWKDRVHPRT